MTARPHIAPETLAQIRRETLLDLLETVDQEAHRLYKKGAFAEWLQARAISSTLFAETLRH